MATSFAEALADGSAGIQLRFADHYRVIEATEHSAVVVDVDNRVQWVASRLPFRLDLAPENEAVLHADLERSARDQFAENWQRRRAEKGPAPMDRGPRIEDPSWSPLVQWSCASLGGAPALCCVSRRVYEPGCEHSVAQCYVPVADGIVMLDGHAVDEVTGGREAALALLRAKATGGPLEYPGQAFYDDPEHDDKFPSSALSRVRRAQRWLLQQSGLRVTRPDAAPTPRGEMVLEAADCALVRPPRFLPVAPGIVQSVPTAVHFARVTLAQLPMLFEAWRVDLEVAPPADHAELAELAHALNRVWESDGAENVRTRAENVPSAAGLIEIECIVDCFVLGRATGDVQRWLRDADGAIWKLSINSPVTRPLDEVRAELATTRATFRRLSTPGASSPPRPPKKRGWWPFGK